MHTLTLGPFICCSPFSLTSASLPQFSEWLAPLLSSDVIISERPIQNWSNSLHSTLIFIMLYFLHYSYHHLIHFWFLICLVSVSATVTNCLGPRGYLRYDFRTMTGQFQANRDEGQPCFFIGMEALRENRIRFVS